MGSTSRPYRDDADLQRLGAFIVTLQATGPDQCYWHIGDLWWGLYQNTSTAPREVLRLWESARGDLIGFTWHAPPGPLIMQSDPRLPVSGNPERAMLAWAEARQQATTPDQPPVPLVTSALERDGARRALLAARGYAPTGRRLVRLRRDLTAPIGLPSLPAGATVRAVLDPADAAARVALHRAVWHPSRVTMPAYRRLRAVAGYRADLDPIAVSPGGDFAAYCLCWLDAANRSGEFEPVGAHSA